MTYAYCQCHYNVKKGDMFCGIILFISVVIPSEGNICEMDYKMADCSRRNLKHIPQNLSTIITVLNLRYNKIKLINSYAFQKYGNLVSLYLDSNELNYLETNAFYGLEKIQNLSMADNNLDLKKAYPFDVLKPLAGLHTLDIRRNMQKEPALVGYPFLGKLKNINTLSIDLSGRPIFDDCGFKNLINLRKIVFDHCFIEQLSNDTFLYISKTVTEIHFRSCKYVLTVDPGALSPFSNLKILHLNQSNIELSSALKLLYPFERKTMTRIDFRRVNPGYARLLSTPYAVIVTSTMMKHLQKICVKALILAENGIVDFEPNSLLSYNYPECFDEIVLSGNRFSFLNAFKMNELWTLSPKLTNLTIFNLSYNPISYGDVNYNTKFPEYNNHSKYGINEAEEYRKCENILNNNTIFMHGNLNTIHEESVCYNFSFSFPLPPKLETLRLTRYMSGQKLGIQLLLLNASNLRYLDMSYFDVDNFPELSLNVPSNIDHIDLSGIASWRQSISLFRNAKTAVLRYAGLWQNIQHRPAYFAFIPNVQTLDIAGNSLWQLRADTFAGCKKLTSLILQGNLFSELPTALLKIPKLKTLDVSGNILDTINETLRDYLDKQQSKMGSFSLSLGKNIFSCTCGNEGFVRWLFNTKVILDESNKEYKCVLSNGSVTTTTIVYNDFHKYFGSCNSELWLRIGVTLLVLFIVFTVPLALVLNFKWQIAYWIYRKFRKVIEREMKELFEYDIYLSYSDDSIVWVKNVLIPKIETSWKMNMCLEDRDILVGCFYADEISKSIGKSRHVIFVITDAFAEREWGKFEIERVKYEKYTKNLQKIIVINKQVSVQQFPSGLDCIWEDVVLINWDSNDGENNWDKLRMTLFTEFI